MSRAARRKVLIEAVRSVTYEQLLQQHAAWQKYAAHALRAAKDAVEASQLMNQLDWHGARIRVVHSRCGSYEHAVGLVLAETKRMLLLLSETKRVWVPKVGSAGRETDDGFGGGGGAHLNDGANVVAGATCVKRRMDLFSGGASPCATLGHATPP